jgi:hypothetical protein
VSGGLERGVTIGTTVATGALVAVGVAAAGKVDVGLGGAVEVNNRAIGGVSAACSIARVGAIKLLML